MFYYCVLMWIDVFIILNYNCDSIKLFIFNFIKVKIGIEIIIFEWKVYFDFIMFLKFESLGYLICVYL